MCVAPQHDLEVRRCLLTNSSDRSRRIELTSYLEWMLCSPEADASHPAFSKLFVETQFCSDRRAILARRRPRHSDESEFWGLHTIVCDDFGQSAHQVQFETNRLRFIGRGRTLASPLALERGASLSGECGPMLDPIASLRVEVPLGPGESREIAFVLGGAPRRQIDELLSAVSDIQKIRRILASAQATRSDTGSLPHHPRALMAADHAMD